MTTINSSNYKTFAGQTANDLTKLIDDRILSNEDYANRLESILNRVAEIIKIIPKSAYAISSAALIFELGSKDDEYQKSLTLIALNLFKISKKAETLSDDSDQSLISDSSNPSTLSDDASSIANSVSNFLN